MTPITKTNNYLQDYLDNILGWNPQLWREVKGKLTIKSLIIVVALSVFTQFAIVINYLSQLPDASYKVLQEKSGFAYYLSPQYSRYCSTDAPYTNNKGVECTQDMLHHWVINWQLFWFDIFVTLSVIGIALLLILGTYFLVINAVAEQKQGTLHLVSLSPQSASNILVGKILGVPILLYLLVILGLPLHTVAALKAHIPLSLVVAFDLAIIASCVFFYSLGLLISFVIPTSINAWIIAIAIAIFLGYTAVLNTGKYQFNTQTILDWLFIFNPNNLILYLGKTTAIHYHYFDYSDFSILGNNSYDNKNSEPIFFSSLLFYGQALWEKVGVGIGLVIANYCLWTYWIWQGLERRFYNKENTVISKQQSYWITGYFIAIALGFSLQKIERDSTHFSISFVFLHFILLLLFLGLIFALTPQSQTLQDWARYRHQIDKKGNILWRELVFGEKSPSIVAIAINAAIVVLYITPSSVIFADRLEGMNIFWCLILSMGIIVLLAAIAQKILLNKSKHRVSIAVATIISWIVALPFLFYLGESSNLISLSPDDTFLAWLFTSFSVFPFISIGNLTLPTIALAILGQWLVITLVSLQITKQLRQAGRSESYKVFNNGSL